MTTLNIILYFIGEFSAAKAKKRNWGGPLTWLGRLLWIVPIASAFAGFCFKNVKMANIYDLIEAQHGIRFKNTKMGDHEFEITKEMGAVDNGEAAAAQKEVEA